jgi:hypothetical protein
LPTGSVENKSRSHLRGVNNWLIALYDREKGTIKLHLSLVAFY